MTDAEKLARASRAQSLIDDELLKEAFKQLEADYITGWKATNARDTEGREKLFLAVQVVGKVRDHLSRVLADGKLTKREIDDLAARKKLLGL